MTNYPRKRGTTQGQVIFFKILGPHSVFWNGWS